MLWWCLSSKCCPRTCYDDGAGVLLIRARFMAIETRAIRRRGRRGLARHAAACSLPYGFHGLLWPNSGLVRWPRASVPGDPWLGIVAGGHMLVVRVLGTAL